MFINFCSNASNPNPLNTDNNRKWELKTPEVIVLLLLFRSCCNQSRKCSLSSNTMSLPYKSIIKKFRHACTSCRGGKEPCLPLQPLWCHLNPHFLTGLEDLAINFLKTPSPFPPPSPPPHPSTGQPLTSCLKNRHFYNFFHPTIKPQRSLPDFLSSRLSCARWGKKQSSRDHGDGEEEDPNPAATSWWGGGAWAGDTKGAGQWAGTARKSERILEFVHRFLSFGEKKHLLFPAILILVMF